ncbi:hypothetical protein AlacWU_03755 [Aspergillus niger]|nr:hypothetical protein AlacWU_03755 [Aspergillus niger]
MSMTYDALSAMLRLFNAIVALAAGSPFLTGALYGKLPHGAAQIFPFAAPMPGVATLDGKNILNLSAAAVQSFPELSLSSHCCAVAAAAA